MRCASCDSNNSEGAKFCSRCGVPLLVRCPACGASGPASAKFCSECAAPISIELTPERPAGGPRIPLQPIAPRAPLHSQEIEGERRHLSVLFCDLVGSTEIASRLDPEEWRELLASCHSCARDAVTRFGGHVAQYLGDGLLVFFGYPHAYEDAPQRAVLAALATLEALSALNSRMASERYPKLAARIGIHSGTVVVGPSHGDEAIAFGEVPNIASRVQSAASPDTVFISAATHHLVSGWFVVEDQGAQPLKGIEHPVHLFRVVQPSAVRSRLGVAALRGLTAFTGREVELRLLLNRWERVREGEGQLILVVGEPGIGKSRLVEHFREQIADMPHTWSDCAAAAIHENTPFYAIEEMLQHGFQWRGEQSDDERIAGLEASLDLAGVNTSEAVPLIAPLVNLAVPAKYPPLRMAPDQTRKRLLATITAWALGIARIQPLIVAVEDLHWADPSTLEVVQLLAEQGATAPLLLICTARPEFRAPWPPRAHHAQLSLDRLSVRDAREMATQLTARAPLPTDAVEAAVKLSGGIPFFVEELIREMIENGDTRPLLPEIPSTLRDWLLARLDRLGEAREVAQVASVIGHEFSWRLLRAIVLLEDEQLNAALKKLADSQLLLEQGIPPEATYKFRHALIQDAAYQWLLRSKRRDYHRRIAQTGLDPLS